MISKSKHITGIAIVAAALSACGGGGGSDPAPDPGAKTSAEGYWLGRTPSSANATNVLALILETGDYWLLYQRSPSEGAVAKGTSTSSNGNLASTSQKNFVFNDPVVTNGSLSGTYTVNRTLRGATQFGTEAITFDVVYVPQYDSPVTTAAINGRWTTVIDGENFSVTIAGDGSLTGQGTSGCNVGGSLLPRASGKFVYDATYRFDAACGIKNGVTFRGQAVPTNVAQNSITGMFTASVDASQSGGYFGFLNRVAQ